MVTKLLIRSGANLNLSHTSGVLAVDIAEEKGFTDILAELQKVKSSKPARKLGGMKWLLGKS
ncbi:MAG: hypothetical protein GQ582_08050 [Methyloprofundus sp.]|nr:hypothetical protein [Methyloprofundus sp.]